jgi:hypothetical protein
MKRSPTKTLKNCMRGKGKEWSTPPNHLIPRLLVLSFDFLIISLSNAANYLHPLILAVTT